MNCYYNQKNESEGSRFLELEFACACPPLALLLVGINSSFCQVANILCKHVSRAILLLGLPACQFFFCTLVQINKSLALGVACESLCYPHPPNTAHPYLGCMHFAQTHTHTHPCNIAHPYLGCMHFAQTHTHTSVQHFTPLSGLHAFCSHTHTHIRATLHTPIWAACTLLKHTHTHPCNTAHPYLGCMHFAQTHTLIRATLHTPIWAACTLLKHTHTHPCNTAHHYLGCMHFAQTHTHTHIRPTLHTPIWAACILLKHTHTHTHTHKHTHTTHTHTHTQACTTVQVFRRRGIQGQGPKHADILVSSLQTYSGGVHARPNYCSLSLSLSLSPSLPSLPLSLSPSLPLSLSPSAIVEVASLAGMEKMRAGSLVALKPKRVKNLSRQSCGFQTKT